MRHCDRLLKYMYNTNNPTILPAHTDKAREAFDERVRSKLHFRRFSDCTVLFSMQQQQQQKIALDV